MKRSSPLEKPRKQDQWISRKEAADLLEVSAATVKNYKLPYRQYKPRGKVFYRRLDILEFKENGCMERGI